MVDANLIKKEDLKKVREVEVALMFNESVKKLVEALGITRKIKKEAGTVLKTYIAEGQLEDGEVAEGEVIPLSKYGTKPINYKEITLKKWRKATSAEAIIARGYEQAVEMTTDRMVKDIQKEIRGNFFDFLEEDTKDEDKGTSLKTKVSGAGLQEALAQAWGNLQVLFEDDTIEAVYFLNPLDVADYLGTAQLTTQSAFGMTYIENFLGLGTVFMNASVTKGSFVATAKENVILYYIATNGADLDEVFDFTSDETGYIGIHEEPDYGNMTASDTMISGMELMAERMDGIVLGTITSVAG